MDMEAADVGVGEGSEVVVLTAGDDVMRNDVVGVDSMGDVDKVVDVAESILQSYESSSCSHTQVWFRGHTPREHRSAPETSEHGRMLTTGSMWLPEQEEVLSDGSVREI